MEQKELQSLSDNWVVVVIKDGQSKLLRDELGQIRNGEDQINLSLQISEFHSDLKKKNIKYVHIPRNR